jgi:hypothetical protein
VTSDPFAVECCGQICDLIDRPLLPTHAESTRTGEIFEIRESVGPCGLVRTMGRKPKQHGWRATWLASMQSERRRWREMSIFFNNMYTGASPVGSPIASSIATT